MSRYLLLIVLLLLGCSDPPLRYEPLPPDAVVLAFGDSVTYGTGAGRGEDYPSLLAQRSGWNVVNAGVPGDTASAASGRIEALLRENAPDLVIVKLGGNDFLRRRAEVAVREDLRGILRTVRSSGATAVLVAVPSASVFGAATGRLSDSAIYAELAKEEKVLLVGQVFTRVLSEDSLLADRIHPNARGYRTLEEGIADALAQAGLLGRHD